MNLKLGILGSGRGSNFVAIAEAIQSGELAAEICLVASDLSEAPILAHARSRRLSWWACPPGKFVTRLEPHIETELARRLETAGANLIVLAGYMRVVKEPLLRVFPNRILNIHPSLLPKFPGLRAWEQALKAGEKETGCTVHWVNEVVDGGVPIASEKVSIMSNDTPEMLHARIQTAEHRLLPRVLRDISCGSIRLPGDETAKAYE
jgi:phosphoribosylglycinamide formyltransferase-1